MLETKIFKRITEIQPEEWNAVFPKVLENYNFFKTLDESGFDQFSFYYILVYDGSTLVGATSCFLMNYPLDTLVSGFLGRVMSPIKKILPGLFKLKILLCGLPMGRGRIGFSGANPWRVTKAILDAMEKLAESERIPFLAFKDFETSYEDIFEGLEREGFFKFQSMPSTEMKVNFASFEEYLKKLSRSSREGVKRKFKKVDGGVKIDLEIANHIKGDLDRIYELYLQTEARGDMQFEILPKKFFEVISENMPNETKYFLWRIDGKLVAFAQCFATDEYFIDYYLGFDYAIAHEYHLYFVRFRDLMNWCIRNGMKIYEMGPTGYEPKRRLGFEFVRLYAYVKHRNRWINPFFKILCFLLKPENHDPVFKQMDRKDVLCEETP